MEKITDKYYLGSNKNTFILYEKKISQTGKEIFKNIGYLTSLETVYTKLIEKEIKEDLSLINNIGKINELVKELKEFTISLIAEQSKD